MAKAIDRKMYEGQNRMAALIIAGNPEKYPGLMAEWAAVILGQGRPGQAGRGEARIDTARSAIARKERQQYGSPQGVGR